jgi:DNA-binding transcriptional regulator GbsR (MarR family)
MDPELEKAHDYFIETAGRLSKNLGLSEIAGQLYALLYLSPDPISLNEMVEKLKMSKASASVNIRALERWGAAKKVWVKGNRRDHYAADRDVWKVASSRLKVGLERRISEANGAIEQVEKMLKDSEKKFNGENKKLARTYVERIKTVRKMSERLEKLLKLLPIGL